MWNIDREKFDNEALIRQIRQSFPRQTFALYGTINSNMPTRSIVIIGCSFESTCWVCQIYSYVPEKCRCKVIYIYLMKCMGKELIHFGDINSGATNPYCYTWAKSYTTGGASKSELLMLVSNFKLR